MTDINTEPREPTMRNNVELRNHEIDVVVAALLSMHCATCPIGCEGKCQAESCCRTLAERIAGGELSEVYGFGED
jgi:hypothetical protein